MERTAEAIISSPKTWPHCVKVVGGEDQTASLIARPRSSSCVGREMSTNEQLFHVRVVDLDLLLGASGAV